MAAIYNQGLSGGTVRLAEVQNPFSDFFAVCGLPRGIWIFAIVSMSFAGSTPKAGLRCSLHMGESIKPGQTAATRIPCVAYSMAAT
jgi:hypothetical protein